MVRVRSCQPTCLFNFWLLGIVVVRWSFSQWRSRDLWCAVRSWEFVWRCGLAFKYYHSLTKTKYEIFAKKGGMEVRVYVIRRLVYFLCSMAWCILRSLRFRSRGWRWDRVRFLRTSSLRTLRWIPSAWWRCARMLMWCPWLFLWSLFRIFLRCRGRESWRWQWSWIWWQPWG